MIDMQDRLEPFDATKLPMAVCHLDASDEFIVDVVSKVAYEQVSQWEVEDPGYPKGGIRLEEILSEDKLIQFEEKQKVNYICFYYVPSGKIWATYKLEEPFYGELMQQESCKQGDLNEG